MLKYNFTSIPTIYLHKVKDSILAIKIESFSKICRVFGYVTKAKYGLTLAAELLPQEQNTYQVKIHDVVIYLLSQDPSIYEVLVGVQM
jgi:hypothetical protein